MSLSVASITVKLIPYIDTSITSQTFVDRNAHEAFFSGQSYYFGWHKVSSVGRDPNEVKFMLIAI